MRGNKSVAALFVLISFVLVQTTGCAAYNTVALVFHGREVIEQERVRVEFAEYYTKERGKLLFQRDLGRKGVFPLAVRVENSSGQVWIVDYEKVFLEDGNSRRYPYYEVEKVRKQRRAWEAGHGLGPAAPIVTLTLLPVMIAGASSSLILTSAFSVILLPIMIPVSVAIATVGYFQARKVSKKAKADVIAKTLPFQTRLEPSETIQGFVFFEIAKKHKNGSFRGVIELQGDPSQESLLFSRTLTLARE